MVENIENQKDWSDVCKHIADQDQVNIYRTRLAIRHSFSGYSLDPPVCVLVGSAVRGQEYNDLDLLVMPEGEQKGDHFGFTQRIFDALDGLSWILSIKQDGQDYEEKETWRLVPELGKGIHLLFHHPLVAYKEPVLLSFPEFLKQEAADSEGPFTVIELV